MSHGLLRLITGKKGAAKTLWTVDHAFKEYEKNPERDYYSDIDELKHSGFKVAPEDWREVPDNSLVIYDEVQFKLLFSRHNNKRDTQILELTTMRKRGITIWIITQKARFLNADVLGLVDEHVHLERNGKRSSKVFIFQDAELMITKTKKLFAFEKYVYGHPQHLYGFYKSIEDGAKHDTSRSYVNKGVVSVIFTLVLAFGFGGYFIYKSLGGGVKVGGEESGKNTEKVHPVGDKVLDAENDKKTAQLVESIRTCQSQFGWTFDQCKQAYDTETEVKRTEALEQSTGNNMEQVVFTYNANKPFEASYTAMNEPTDFPKFSGCMKKNGKYVAYTQQGTILHDVSTSDCRRVIDDGDRPFNYYAEKKEIKPVSPQDDDNYKKAYLENIARLDAERYAKSFNAEVQAEPLDMNQSRTSLITGANSL